MPGLNHLLRLRTQHLAAFLNSHRLFFYTLLSLATVSAVILNALKNYSNFYSVAIYLSKSSRSVLVLANFGVLLTLFAGHIIQRIFFGSLRPNEVERLYDRLWFFITESLLAFTIFRDEFDTPFALMFGFLLFVKSFHWLASDRIEWMDQRPYPGPPLLFHFRMAILFTILWLTDCFMFLFAAEHTLSVGVGGMVLFASEYGILMASVLNTILKYLLSTYDLRRAGRRGGENAPPWENKSMWIFYIELATDFLKLTTYLVFFIIIITFYGLPLNIIRDVYITARSFITRLRALHRYQTATRNMDQRYPNATEEELLAMSDRTCIICREEMVNTNAQDPPAHADGPNTTPKKLPCGHIFHFHCLRSWLERQQSCPTCRRNVLENPVNPQVPPVGGPQDPPARPAPGQHPGNQAPLQNAQIPQGQGQGQGGGANNPLGFLGRYIGIPPRQGNPPVNRQIVQNANNHQVQGNAQGPGIYISYQVQYQLPRPNNEAIQTAGQQQLPVPPYPGFPGPGGAWQPWPTDNAAPTTQTSANSRVTPASQEPSSSETADNRSQSSGESSSSVLANASSSSEHSHSSEEAQSPREAAAKAALNRLGVKPSGDTLTKETLPASTSSSTPTQVTPSQTEETSQTPQLIPLLGFRFLGPTPTRTLPQTSSSRFNTQQPYSTSPSSRFTRSSGTTQMPPNASTFLPQNQRAFPDTTPTQLPAALTDEQLATLDRVTRESIDERLRILENVSASVYRSIDDLMRLRSALPPMDISSTHPDPVANRSSPAPPTNLDEAEPSEKLSERGKEKMREPSVDEPSPDSLTDDQEDSIPVE